MVSNKRVLEALVSAVRFQGARKGMLEVLEQAVGWGHKQQSDRLAGRARSSTSARRMRTGRSIIRYAPHDEFEKTELLKLEKEVLGLYCLRASAVGDPRPASSQVGHDDR